MPKFFTKAGNDKVVLMPEVIDWHKMAEFGALVAVSDVSQEDADEGAEDCLHIVKLAGYVREEAAPFKTGQRVIASWRFAALVSAETALESIYTGEEQ